MQTALFPRRMRLKRGGRELREDVIPARLWLIPNARDRCQAGDRTDYQCRTRLAREQARVTLVPALI